ncbi:MAG: hypothetical protein ACJ74W_17415 [Pyrinomonadaceae bacterium]
MLARRAARRLPGFRFETQSPPLSEWLPRMDVCYFVGFTASGPIDTPVAVESVAHFNAIFGADIGIARDAVLGEQAQGHLAPTVRAFFANGGRRCWIMRVARLSSPTNPLNRARSNYFPVPGLAMATLDAQGQIGHINPAFARARSEGSWSDALETSAALLSRSVEVVSTALDQSLDKLTVDLAVDTPDDIVVGDLLRLTFQEGYVLLLYVGAVEVLSASTAGQRARVRVTGAQGTWLYTRAPRSRPRRRRVVRAQLFSFDPPPTAESGADEEQTVVDRFRIRYEAILQPVFKDAPQTGSNPPAPPAPTGALTRTGQEVTLDINVAPEDAPAPGALVAVDLPTSQLWVTVQQSSVTSHGPTAAGTGVRVVGEAVWWTGRAPATLPQTIIGAERLSFELWVRRADDYAFSVSDLAFHPAHARYWAQLPTDRAVYQQDETAQVKEPTVELWRPVAGDLRFPLAGSPAAGDAIFFPLALPALPTQFMRAVRLAGSTLERDGLAEFDADLFLDSDLSDATTEDLLARAEFLRYLSTSPRKLRGIYAALEIEEVTLIAVPDAVQRGWTKTEPKKAALPADSEPLARPAWWRFDCVKRDQPPPVKEPPAENFLNCDLRVVPPPTLSVSTELTQAGTFTLTWVSAEADAEFILEEANALDTNGRITGASVIYGGPLRRFTLYGRRDGDYYYRVRVIAHDGNESDWSNGVAVRVAAAGAWQLSPEEKYDNGALLAVQRALLRMTAARGDLLAVLSMPAHYREDKALEHAALLKRFKGDGSGDAAAASLTAGNVPLFSAAETRALSYGALYHPWLVGSDAQAPGAFRRVPPDGAACGVLAQRALTRGAWIAPANEIINGVIALTPRVRRERWLDLQNAQLNLIRQDPRGFLALNADTLSDDESVRLINVRRLLILLRRLALRHGATYVFEPNGDALRRSVQRGFEGLLDLLFLRGAFAGATAATSFQVNTSDTINTRQSVEAGRFIVELKVAPAEPLTFVTLRLVQTGERGVVTEVR